MACGDTVSVYMRFMWRSAGAAGSPPCSSCRRPDRVARGRCATHRFQQRSMERMSRATGKLTSITRPRLNCARHLRSRRGRHERRHRSDAETGRPRYSGARAPPSARSDTPQSLRSPLSGYGSRSCASQEDERVQGEIGDGGAFLRRGPRRAVTLAAERRDGAHAGDQPASPISFASSVMWRMFSTLSSVAEAEVTAESRDGRRRRAAWCDAQPDAATARRDWRWSICRRPSCATSR